MRTIFVVDDEKKLLNVIKKYLENEGYSVRMFADARSALKHIEGEADLWLLDIMLGDDLNGYDLIKAIKEKTTVPVMFMSARDKELDRVMGLEMGSDDYITKPFSMRELVLRINNIIKRVYDEQGDSITLYDEYSIDTKKRTVTQKGQPVALTSKEMDLVLHLLHNKNISFTRDQLLNSIWGTDYYGSDRVVDDLIKRIRKKMPHFNIETIYGYGYRLT